MQLLWQPTASVQALKMRAKILSKIRDFFAQRNVLEVETPLLSQTTVTDPHIASISVLHQSETLYLQTSPEYAMKRLLAAGTGSIYQLCKAFRAGDSGKQHNPEFTMLEWYRIGYDHHALMDEMDELLGCILETRSAERITSENLYQYYLNISPHTVSLEDLQTLIRNKINFRDTIDRKTCLELLFTHCIEPFLGLEKPLFLYDFPISQAALARIRNENPPIASRFEVYYKGLELANGFHELADGHEQRKRFQNDLQNRHEFGLPCPPIDEHLLAALEYGLPDCAGVALGVDRLVMLALHTEDISRVMSFKAFDN